MVGAGVSNVKNGQTVATVAVLSMMLVGGYFVRGIPVWIAWLKYLSIYYWCGPFLL